MEITLTVRGMDEPQVLRESRAIKNYIEDNFKKIEKLLSHVGEPVNVDVVITVVRPHPYHICEIRIRAPHFDVIVQKENPEMYRAIDEAIDVTVKQLVDHKEKMIVKRKQKF